MASSARVPRIDVLAGPNGAGKSSIIGAMVLESGGDFFNPDAVADRIQSANSYLSRTDANSMAWRLGRDLLERAIEERLSFAFETTLGGNTIAALLQKACDKSIQVRIWFVCLATPELHIERVRARVARGGHDIPEAQIRARYDRSRANIIRLLPHLSELRVFDNSFEAAFAKNVAPRPRPILHMKNGRVVAICEPTAIPVWAKPIVAAAMRLSDTTTKEGSKH